MLNERQLKACLLLASGRTDAEAYKSVAVSERTFYKWKAKPEFKASLKVLLEQKASDASRQADELVNLASARQDEENILSHQREMVSELGKLSLDLIKHIRSSGVEELSPRSMPGIVKAFSEAVSGLQATNDRLIGLEGLLEDVAQIEKTLQEKLIDIEGRGSAKSASGQVAR